MEAEESQNIMTYKKIIRTSEKFDIANSTIIIDTHSLFSFDDDILSQTEEHNVPINSDPLSIGILLEPIEITSFVKIVTSPLSAIPVDIDPNIGFSFDGSILKGLCNWDYYPVHPEFNDTTHISFTVKIRESYRICKLEFQTTFHIEKQRYSINQIDVRHLYPPIGPPSLRQF